MNTLRSTVWFGLVIGFIAVGAQAATYTGSLTYTPPWPPGTTDGLNVGPSNLQWQGYTVTIAWTVTDTDTTYPSHPWKYTYHFSHNGTQAAFSHMIIEASPGIDQSAIVGVSGGTLHSVTTQFAGPGNPEMPEDMYGIKFEPLESVMDWTVTFYANRTPVWGDFYGRCGGKAGGINYAYNYNKDAGDVERGFLDGDTDPTGPPQSDSVDFHILRPDSYIAEPGTIGLIALGALAVCRRRGR